MDRTPGCGPGGWRFDSSRVRMSAEIPSDSLNNHRFELRRQGVSPEIEAESVVVRVSARQFMEVNFGYAQAAEFLESRGNTPISPEQEAVTRESLDALFETREERMERSLLHFQKEKVRNALSEGKHIIFRYQS